MQLEIKQPSLPEVTIANFDELKQELQCKMDHYRGIVYTDDQIKEAKKDLASLRKFTSALSDERIRVKKEWLKPVESFESKIKELTAIVNEPITLISKQVQEYEEQQKAEKLEKIKEYIQTKDIPEGVKIGDPKWLNASVSMKSIHEAIDEKVEQIRKDLAVIRALPAYAFEAEQVYLSSLDLAKAVSESHRLSEMAERKAAYEAEQAKRKEEAAARQAEEVNPEPELAKPMGQKKQWLSFRAKLTIDDAIALKKFLQSRNIEFERI